MIFKATFATLAAVAALLALPAPHALATPVPDGDDGRILGGEDVAAGEIPYMVALERKDSSCLRCGGILLDAHTVLTAAHCSPQYAENMQVRAHSIEISTGGVVTDVSSIIINPDWDGDSYRSEGLQNRDACVVDADGNEHDYAIWKLKDPIKSGRFPRLPEADSDPSAGTSAFAAGWGRGSNGRLKRVSVPIVDRAACARALDHRGNKKVTDSMICAGGQLGEDACNGDSGGPLMGDDGVLLGVVSWGIGCGAPGLPGVYARVGVAVPFIKAWLE